MIIKTKEIKITPPEGYEIDKENSTFDCIKFKPVAKRWREGNWVVSGYCNSYYTNLGRVFNHFNCHYFADDEHDKVDILTQTLRPTHQMAMKWLRDYPYYIFIGIKNQYLFSYEVYHYHIRCKAPKREIDKVGKIDYRTYEEAVEAAIKYSLENLI